MRIIGFRAPWSGDVLQSISPSLVNINIGSSGSPQTEEQILDKVGSYGRQIGRISDALYVLIEVLKDDGLNASKLNVNQQNAIEAFRVQHRQALDVKREVEATVRQIRNPPWWTW
jgi:hypothetical protein